ncbi:MAG: glycosyl transferase [Pirellulales bacterium]|nr:glycosyl transferase [Pirellulales bacterium]
MEVQSSAASGRSASPVAPRGDQFDGRVQVIEDDRPLRSMLTAMGGGRLLYGDLAVTRWTGDEVGGRDGVFVYLRDLEDGRFWSATWQPTSGAPEQYEVDFRDGSARYVLRKHDVVVETEVRLCTASGAELRRCQVTNAGARRRRIELTSYLEWVLQDAAADYAHPAFSKLFVETEYLAEAAAIVAGRRQRDPRQGVLAGAHWLAEVVGRSLSSGTEYETSRMDFIGRGCDLRSPAALVSERPLAGKTGPVLDPIASLRRSFILHPDESATIVFATTAGRSRDDVLRAVRTPIRWPTEPNNGAGIGPLGRATALNSEAPRRALDDGQRLRTDLAHTAAPRKRYQPLRVPLPRRASDAAAPGEPLEFDNGLGGFTPGGDEYVIRLQADEEGQLRLPPLPWSHVVANPQAGFIATERGAGYTWTANSRENRLTHWSNDPVCDPHSEALYLRDRERGAYWSPLPGPTSAGVSCQVRYGFGYARFSQSCAGLDQSVVQFVPREDPVKISRLTLKNNDDRPRQVDLFAYAHLALGNGTRESAEGIRTWLDEESGSLLAMNASRELSSRVAFARLIAPTATSPARFATERREFIGPHGDLRAPQAVEAMEQLSDRSEQRGDGCFALQQTLEIPPHGQGEAWLLLGEAASDAEARRIIARYTQPQQLDEALAAVRRWWRRTLDAVQIATPAPALDLMVNGWLPYQNISCRLWGRSAYYQSGGAYGFRDQLQDAAALVYHWPELTRAQIVRHAGSQFVEGDVLHWWHPPSQRGIRTRFADDLLWLPLLASEYAGASGDAGLWDERAPYVTGPQLEPDEAERFFAAKPAGGSGTIYEHCCRAIDRSLGVGAHGLPLIGCGDWNDGMNRIGEGGRGESVWMGFFLHETLQRFIPVCEARGDAARAESYRAHQRQLRAALDGPGWDGQWYRRAFFDDGQAVGTAGAEECQIDALVQAWAVLSGAGEPARALQAVDAAEARLVDEQARLIRLLDPPFDRLPQDPGYIKGYVPGVRENGGQYTHGVLWLVRAVARLGRGGRAVELLEMLNPVNHARTIEEVAVYQAEPYVVAADVYSQPPHVGRAGWTWYTGSAGWMWRVAAESILGLQIRDGRTLVLSPVIPAAWPACELRYRLPDGATAYHIRIENPQRRETGVASATLDGRPAPVNNKAAEIPLVADGEVHQVAVRL